ncbi:thaumatin-like protein 1 [Wolffia australiana]
MTIRSFLPIFVCALLAVFFSKTIGAQASSFRFLNNCNSTLWVGTLAGAGTAPLQETGFELNAGKGAAMAAPPAWSGRFWARTGCAGSSPGQFKCATGDCGSGKIECGGAAGAPPATLVEITLAAGGGGNDFYDISLVDGFNVPVSISRRGCATASCAADVNVVCPKELRVLEKDKTTVAACMSACEKFGDPVYCCTGEYGGAATCQPSVYSRVFKRACPLAYSYAFDDASSVFTCASFSAAEYLVTFCP